ncbi:DUF4105 domain-containing protein [Methylorubrum zatmanii]|uniref:HdeD family acid-resistance protein n=2 Tax=Methylorubrum zatmanii TaxID=29429 RepID=A0ABW1WSA1_9HYPH|nr:DUF4105 domain-containing protein [Methylorubrum zatmanii]
MSELPSHPLQRPLPDSAAAGGDRTIPGESRTIPLWLLLVGRAAVHRHWHLLLVAGLVCAVLGGVVVVDALDGALHVPDRWFGILLLADGAGSLAAGIAAVGAARRLRLLKGAVLLVMAVLIVMATRHSVFLLAMIFGTAFLIDGTIRMVIAYLLRFPGWRASAALGAFGIMFGLFHLQPWPTWYAGTVGYCIGMFLILNGARLALAGLRTRRLSVGVSPAAASTLDSLTVYAWTPTGHASTPARQRLVRRYVAAVDARGVLSTGHAALEQGSDLYISHYPAVEIDRSMTNLRSQLRAGSQNDVPGRFLTSYRAEADDWCEATVAVTLSGIDATRLRAFWQSYRQDTTYNFIGRNCSTAVARALDAAVEGVFARSGHPWRRLAVAVTTPEFWAAAVLRNGAASMTWTPGLVLDYSRALSVLVDPVASHSTMAWASVGRRFIRHPRIGSLIGWFRMAKRRPVQGAGSTEA